MKKLLLSLSFLALATSLSAQQYLTREGNLTFDAGSPLEDVVAKSNSATSVYDASNGKLGVQVLMTSFEFKRALMQEHFNENYAESEKYPKASFKGMYKDGMADGTLTIHGVSKPVKVPATLEEKDGAMHLKTSFDVTIADFGIDIPKAVADKIDSEAKVDVDCLMKAR